MSDTVYITPQSIEAEQAILGSMMLDEIALETGIAMLTAADFVRPVHQDVFVSLKSLGARNEPVDLISLQEELRGAGKLEEIGGTEYLMALVDSVPTSANAEYYASVVREKSESRSVIAVCHNVISAASDPSAKSMSDYLIEQALSLSRDGNTGFVHINQVVEKLRAKLENIENGVFPFSVPFRLDTLNKFYPGGLSRDDLFIVGAETSEGKSIVLAEIIQSALRERVPTALVTCEMSNMQYVTRMVCSAMQIDSESLTKPGIDFDKVFTGVNEFYDAPFWIFDKTPTLRELEAISRRWALQNAIDGKGLLVIDYAGLIKREGGFNEENTETARIIERLKSLQRDLEIPLATASQFRKKGQGERRHNSNVWQLYPTDVPFRSLDDMLGSSAIMNAADKVLILYNPKDGELRDDKRPAFMFNAKCRNGMVGHKAMVWFKPSTTSFHDCTENYIPDSSEPVSVSFWDNDTPHWNDY